jgi:hypothetical protein
MKKIKFSWSCVLFLLPLELSVFPELIFIRSFMATGRARCFSAHLLTCAPGLPFLGLIPDLQRAGDRALDSFFLPPLFPALGW